MSKELNMDYILKMKPELFAVYCKKQGITFVISLQKLLKVQYSQLNLARISLVTMFEKKDEIEIPEEDVKRVTKNLDDIYLSMQLIEDRYNILEELNKVMSVDKSKH